MSSVRQAWLRGATVTVGIGPDGITTVDQNRAGEGAARVFEKIAAKLI